MNKRFCKLGNYAAKAFFLLAVCGSTYSCKDDYMFDDTTPSWLGSSIYEYLDKDGNYKNFVKLINDLDYKEVLERTGSKTLFVADDEAFETFYKSNPWGVGSYDELTISQKRLLLNSAMVNNAYLLEMMSSTAAGGGTNDEPRKGECLRRETALSVTDSVSHLFEEDIPVNYGAENDYWARFRNKDKGIYIALDATSPMMTHFLASQMANKKITDEDFKIITGKTREPNDAYIYDSKVVEQDITCQNGYINKLDKVLLIPQNMAEVLRTGADTKVFSHLIDRFSAPFYDASLTDRYRLIYGNEVDSVFQKRYFAVRSQNGTNLFSDAGTDPTANQQGNTLYDTDKKKPLTFDPGWNTYYYNSTTAKEQDMAAIFAPCDDKLIEYFFAEKGGGHFLIKAYAPEYVSQINEETKDFDLIYKALDRIPQLTISALINNLMKESFCNSVPSKFVSIKNDAQDPMFDEKDNYHRDNIKDVRLANNGVIYVMNEVITPARYAAVSAPAFVETDKRIFNWAVTSQSLGGVRTDYGTYLLAMSSRFSFFVPNDNSFWYVDPLSFQNLPTSTTPAEPGVLIGRALNFTFNNTTMNPDVKSYEYLYDIVNGTGTIGSLTKETVSTDIYGNRLKDMLETHTIVHEDNKETTGIDETKTGVECDQHYFITKNNAIMYVNNAASQTNGMTVAGGWQISNGTSCKVTGFDDKTREKNGYGNGFAYMIDQPMVPTLESVYSAMANNPEFSEFLALCETDITCLKALGTYKSFDLEGNEVVTDFSKESSQSKYKIFVNNKGIPCYSHENGAIISSATNVRFFSNYNYTIYIPTNEAIKEAHAKGLPTWQDVRDYMGITDDDPNPDLTKEQKDVAIAMITEIINFIKYHFQDHAVFADTPALKLHAYESATINKETGIYNKLNVSSTGEGTLSIEDVAGHKRNVTSTKNIITRDYVTNGVAGINNKIVASSSAVIHGINGVLNYKEYKSGSYSEDWSTPAKARAYVKKYPLVDK